MGFVFDFGLFCVFFFIFSVVHFFRSKKEGAPVLYAEANQISNKVGGCPEQHIILGKNAFPAEFFEVAPETSHISLRIYWIGDSGRLQAKLRGLKWAQ